MQSSKTTIGLVLAVLPTLVHLFSFECAPKVLQNNLPHWLCARSHFNNKQTVRLLFFLHAPRAYRIDANRKVLLGLKTLAVVTTERRVYATTYMTLCVETGRMIYSAGAYRPGSFLLATTRQRAIIYYLCWPTNDY